MEIVSFQPGKERATFYRWGRALALVTIFYNIVEGLVSVSLGVQDETIALFGFGLDSFVEVISGIGIWHMIRRMRGDQMGDRDDFERRALRITGSAFYLLTVGLAATAALSIKQGHRPVTTFWGIVVSIVSILFMWILIHYKLKIGRRFNSRALLADAACSKACMYLSLVLLFSSVGFQATGISWFDSLGAVGIAVFSFREGREAFQKAKGVSCGCGGECRS